TQLPYTTLFRSSSSPYQSEIDRQLQEVERERLEIERRKRELERRASSSRAATAPTTLLSYTNEDIIDSARSYDSLPERSVPRTISLPSSQQEMLNIVIDADMNLNDYLLLYDNNDARNLDGRRFRNILKDSSLIVRRSNMNI